MQTQTREPCSIFLIEQSPSYYQKLTVYLVSNLFLQLTNSIKNVKISKLESTVKLLSHLFGIHGINEIPVGSLVYYCESCIHLNIFSAHLPTVFITAKKMFKKQ